MFRNSTRKLMVAAAALALVPAGLVLAGCGGSSNSTTTAAPSTQPATSTAGTTTTPPATETTSGTTTQAAGEQVQVTADPSGQLAFTEKTLTASAGKATFVLTNASPVPHNLAIEGNGVDTAPTKTVSNGETADLTATLKPGEYQFYCAVPGHRAAGMEGTLTVK